MPQSARLLVTALGVLTLVVFPAGMLRAESRPIAGTYVVTLGASDLRVTPGPMAAQLAGKWSVTFGADGSYTVRKDGTDLRQLTFAHGGTVQYFASSYSPDGRRITFARTPGIGPDGNADVYTMNVDGTHVRRVTNNALWDSRPDWGPAPNN